MGKYTIYWRAVVRRAFCDALVLMGYGSFKKLCLRAGIPAFAIMLLIIFAGDRRGIDEVYTALAVVAATLLVFALVLLVFLCLTPGKLAREQEGEIAEQKAKIGKLNEEIQFLRSGIEEAKRPKLSVGFTEDDSGINLIVENVCDMELDGVEVHLTNYRIDDDPRARNLLRPMTSREGKASPFTLNRGSRAYFMFCRSWTGGRDRKTRLRLYDGTNGGDPVNIDARGIYVKFKISAKESPEFEVYRFIGLNKQDQLFHVPAERSDEHGIRKTPEPGGSEEAGTSGKVLQGASRQRRRKKLR